MRLKIKLSQAHGMRHIQILFKFPSDLLQELEQRNSKKRLMDWFKQLVLNQIRGGPLKESHMINAWFRLFKFPNSHFHEIGSWLAHYGEKIYYFPFSDTFPFLEEAIRETNQLFLFESPSFHFNWCKAFKSIKILIWFRFFPIYLD